MVGTKKSEGIAAARPRTYDIDGEVTNRDEFLSTSTSKFKNIDVGKLEDIFKSDSVMIIFKCVPDGIEYVDHAVCFETALESMIENHVNSGYIFCKEKNITVFVSGESFSIKYSISESHRDNILMIQ